MNRDVQPVALFTENSGLSSVANSSLLNKNCLEKLNQSSELFYKSLKLGRIRGVVGIADFQNFRDRDDAGYIQFIQELINRDILVTVFRFDTNDLSNIGISDWDIFQNAGDGLAEFCEFIGINPVLEIADSAEKQDVLDFYHAMAKLSEVGTVDFPVVEVLTDSLSEQYEGVGKIFMLEGNFAEAVELVDAYIHDKRLGVQWCDRCGGRFSPFS